MGNKPVKQEREAMSPSAPNRPEFLLKIVPPLDHAYVRWLARDLERIHGFTPRNCRAVTPPDHYVEYMRSHGWLDVNLDDPDLAHLFPNLKKVSRKRLSCDVLPLPELTKVSRKCFPRITTVNGNALCIGRSSILLMSD
ncbi:hypothetical protein NC653_012028 [Populus alba x Populus x berolinensis]|uniref:Uncharacterized protein n=1 Tax=Populus alba x Populus x berolinensis TaxID=444605 RepID=A0AAD6W786_9ROSI|nr:hypothetical protein NC653_012028 [Populus alba x Populus x berolinensis]